MKYLALVLVAGLSACQYNERPYVQMDKMARAENACKRFSGLKAVTFFASHNTAIAWCNERHVRVDFQYEEVASR